MAQGSEFTLRLEILRRARDLYSSSCVISEDERMLHAILVMECDAMIKELMAQPVEITE